MVVFSKVKFLLCKSEVGDASEVWLTPSEVKFAVHFAKGETSLRSNFTATATSLAAGKLS